MAKAMIFGTALGIAAAAIMTPLVFFPQLHPGFFSHNLGFTAVLSIFIWHWVYGFALGSIYNPLPDEQVVASQIELGQAITNGAGRENGALGVGADSPSLTR